VPVVRVNDAEVHITDTGAPPGRPDAPVVVFGHGLLFSGRMFAPQVAALRGDHRCITVDWRGQGDSPAAPGGYDMDTLLDDLVGVLDHLGLGAVHYVGLSMGGFVGMRLAARRPERVRTLTLLDTSAGSEDRVKVVRYRLMAGVYTRVGIGPLRRPVTRILFGRTFLAGPRAAGVVREWAGVLNRNDRAGTVRAIRGVTDRTAVTPELPRITAPTLVVVGDEDVATPLDKAEAVAAGIPGARLVVVDGAGHSSTVEAPEAVSRLLRDFLEAHAG
jgi:pimeloyl-ACP methyl ester carboxylesterase